MNPFDFFELLSSEFFGSDLFKTSATAFITWGLTRFYVKWKLMKKYGRCAAKYKGFSLKDGKLDSQPSSEAEVTYLHDNLLKLRLSHDGGSFVWEGTLTMETEDNGTVVWQYVVPAGNCQFGFKRCIWNGKDRLYLVGEKLEGYGHEVLIRQNSGEG